VRVEDLLRAFAPDGAYHPGIVSALDGDGDGVLAETELALDTAGAVEAVRKRLSKIGLVEPRIVGEIQPYPVQHGVTTDRWATRECRDCHGDDSRLARPFVLARLPPGGVVPRLVGDSEVELAGRIELDAAGQLVFAPEPRTAGLYVLGHDATRWANWIGLGALLGALAGVGVHGGLRLRAARGANAHPGGEPVYMYSAYQRFWHWLQALAIFVLMGTGIEIHMPGGLPLLGFELAVRVHNIVGFVVVANALFAALYHLASGQIQQYLPAPEGFFSQAIQQARYYLSGIFKGERHPFEKTPRRRLNPLQQFTYLGILNVLLPLQVVTGILIWGVQRWPAIDAWLGGLAVLAAVHALGAWLFAAFLVMHVYLTTTGPTPAANIRAMVLGWESSHAHESAEKGDTP